MSTRSLPARPNVDQLKLQARELHRAHADGDTSAAARLAAHHPDLQRLTAEAILARPLTLAEAQLVVAREYGFQSWAQLKHYVESLAGIARLTPHPQFGDALAALDAGDLTRLGRILEADPSLVEARTNLDPPYSYFSGATLLHHVAGNPSRDQPLPDNVVDVARLLLEAGADVNARTLGPNGGDTLGLLITSKQASDSDVTASLMDLLLEHGAQLDLAADDALDIALANHAPRAAEKMIELGANPDVLAAAALGRMDLLETLFDGEGRLAARPTRQGRQMSEREAVGRALLLAYVADMREAVDWLLAKDGDWNVIGAGNGTVLHRAAGAGDLDMVKRLVARGADVNARDEVYDATPLSWANYSSERVVFDWMRTHCAVDIHDAVTFGLRDQVDARLGEDPAAVNARRDQYELKACTPLHCAAQTRRADLARLLLDRGADPSPLTGSGVTPLDVADFHGATAVVALLEERGGTRSPEAARSLGDPKLKSFERLASDVLEAYRSGAEAAVQRLQDFFKTRLTAWDVRRAVRVRLQKGATSGSDALPDISVAEARDVVAGVRGFGSWADLVRSVTRAGGGGRAWGRPVYSVDEAKSRLEIRRPVDDDEWDEILRVVADGKIATIEASGQMTDGVLARVAELPHVTGLLLARSKRLTDAGVRALSRLPALEHVNLSGCSISDRGLEVLRDLSALRVFELHWHADASDEGLAHLAACNLLERVDLLGTPAGDEVLKALAGKAHLRHLKTGTRVTDAGLPRLHDLPVFKAWRGGEERYSLMAAEADPNHLLIDGPFTDAGLAALRGLDGLFGLSFFWHSKAFTPEGLVPLADLPRLTFLGCESYRCTDEAMRRIAALPRLRMLQAQGTVATDAGFAALARSATLEYLWGRECPRLTGPGFSALISMPSLRGLAVSCKYVDDGALSELALSRTLRELMPMDVADAGFRHVGRCENLEALWCMYCHDTTDAATAHIAGLSKLRTYYAGQTGITDQSLEILSRMESLEKLEFWNCAGITNAGAALLARLPRLREVTFGSCRHVTSAVVDPFPPHVRATFG